MDNAQKQKIILLFAIDRNKSLQITIDDYQIENFLINSIIIILNNNKLRENL
jgi:hypothetical protein